jgi:subtilisin-like proprotein convertase family protein/uncharacterized protein YvpB
MKNLILSSPFLGLILASLVFFPRFYSILERLPAPQRSPSTSETAPRIIAEELILPESVAIEERNLFFPLLFNQPQPPPPPPPEEPPQKLLFCNSENFDIPDNHPLGITSTTHISEPGYIVDLEVRLDIEHSFVGDLVVTLSHQETGRTISLVDRPGLPGRESGCPEDNVAAILDDGISLPVETTCSDEPAAISGIYVPNQPLQIFNQEAIFGNWSLIVSDNGQDDTGQLQEWCLTATLAEQPVPPVEPPQPPELPEHAQINGVTGQGQALPLDCESRSAVDWANFFDVQINEFTFFDRLPESDNPDKGFVGNVYGIWGQIPPDDYGVHAEPVAKLLTKFGLEAEAHRPLSWDQLRAEIASGRPVIAWIVGPVVNGVPEYYLPSDEQLTLVARYEHTVIVTGYTSDSVTYLNGANRVTKSKTDFLQSWSVMGNMAVTRDR